MILLIYFTILTVFLRKTKSVALLLLVLFLVSLFGACLINQDYEIKNIEDVINLIFLGTILTILVLPWKNFRNDTGIVVNCGKRMEKKIKNISTYLLLTCGLSFIILLIGLFYTFSSVVDYSAFKNAGEGYDFIKTQLPINSTIYFLSQYLSGGAYFLIPLHFYFLLKRNYRYSIFCFIFSLSLILSGLVVFSRSNFVLYVILYILYYFLFYKKIPSKGRLFIKRTAFILLFFVITFFAIITLNRFGEDSTDYTGTGAPIGNQDFVQNQVIYSLIDYFSQWYQNGMEVMSLYDLKTREYKSSFPFLYTILDKLGFINNYANNLLYQEIAIWPNHYWLFNGLVPNLLFDFGYIGTFIFAIIYVFLLKRFCPKKNIITFPKMLFLSLFFIIPAMSIFGSWLRNPFYHFSLVYAIIFYLYLYKT